MTQQKLPPGQHIIDSILRWGEEHPGITDNLPDFNPEEWKLTVNGAVKYPQEYTWDSFLKLPMKEITADFHCVEGWSVTRLRWYGVPFTVIAEKVVPEKEVKYVYFKCADGYYTSIELSALNSPDVILAVKLNGEWLDKGTGAPVRLVIPSKYAYKSAMYLTEIRFTYENKGGYWEERGYSFTADVWKNDRYSR